MNQKSECPFHFTSEVSIFRDGCVMTFLMKSDDDSGSMVGRAQYEQSISSETNISTTGATGSKLPLTIMPPEIWDSRENVNFATDVWSFSILLWELFTGGQDVNRHMKCLYAQASSSSPFSSEKIRLNQTRIC